MAGMWRTYWLNQLDQIKGGLDTWRVEGLARVAVSGLGQLSTRVDLYTGAVTVVPHGPIKGAGQRHRLELGLMVAEQLKEGETVVVRIRRSSAGDYLELGSR